MECKDRDEMKFVRERKKGEIREIIMEKEGEQKRSRRRRREEGRVRVLQLLSRLIHPKRGKEQKGEEEN